MTLILVAILVIALVLQGFYFRTPVTLAGGKLQRTARSLFRRFLNALLISATYQITWQVGSRLARWLWRAAFFHGPAALILALISAAVFFLWPGLSLKLASHLFPRRLGKYSWSAALEVGLIMALTHIIVLCGWAAFWLFY